VIKVETTISPEGSLAHVVADGIKALIPSSMTGGLLTTMAAFTLPQGNSVYVTVLLPMLANEGVKTPVVEMYGPPDHVPGPDDPVTVSCTGAPFEQKGPIGSIVTGHATASESAEGGV